MRIEFTDRAIEQLDNFITYYYQVSQQVGASFELALNEAEAALLRFYKSEVKYDGVRTYRVKQFHVRLHYRVDESLDIITVDGVFDERSMGRID